MRISIAQLKKAGIILASDEAVAIAQQLIASFRAPHNEEALQAPYGPPTADNVFLRDDGSVVCCGCEATPAVSELGAFLEDLFPEGSRMPGGLRYAIARAQLNVDVPPFDSLDEFSRDLSRHERGDRAAAVRRVLSRLDGDRALAPPMRLVERRRSRTSASTTSLRHELREADERLYLQMQRAALDEKPAVIDLIAAKPAPHRWRTSTAAAACLGAGLSLIGAGEYMHRNGARPVVDQAVPVAVTTTGTQEPRVERAPADTGLGRGIIAVRESTDRMQAVPGASRIAAKRTAPPSVPDARQRSTTPSASRGMLDRLRLGWLRKPFASRSGAARKAPAETPHPERNQPIPTHPGSFGSPRNARLTRSVL
jgi:hypothetical protein